MCNCQTRVNTLERAIEQCHRRIDRDAERYQEHQDLLAARQDRVQVLEADILTIEQEQNEHRDLLAAREDRIRVLEADVARLEGDQRISALELALQKRYAEQDALIRRTHGKSVSDH